MLENSVVLKLLFMPWILMHGIIFTLVIETHSLALLNWFDMGSLAYTSWFFFWNFIACMNFYGCVIVIPCTIYVFECDIQSPRCKFLLLPIHCFSFLELHIPWVLGITCCFPSLEVKMFFLFVLNVKYIQALLP